MQQVRVHILGSCSGTDPYAGRHHTSVAVETENGLYWLDAGECCSYTAHLMGIDLLKTRGIFISHCHMDHVGGLGNLLWTIRKLTVMRKRQPISDVIPVYIPYQESYEAVMNLLAHTEDDFRCDYAHEGRPIHDGIVYQGTKEEGGIVIMAVHNHHLAHEEGSPWRAFSFRIEVQGKKIFYSGDTNLADLEYTVPDETDLLMMETGHHEIADVCDFLKKHGKKTGKLLLIHHGVKILQDPDWARREVKIQWGGNAVIAEDGMTISL